MNQKPLLIGCGVVLFLFAGNAATQEYKRIQDRIEKTQAKVDALTDELRATSQKLRSAIEAIAKRFSQPVEAKQVQSKAEPKTFAPPVVPTIIMHSADEEKGMVCGPCRAWIATEKAKWENVGWKVEIVKETETKLGWPWFRLIDNDGTFDVIGPLTSEKVLAAKKAR